MKEIGITFKTAILAKKKGFVEPTFEYFRLNTIRKTPIISNILHTGLRYQELENWNNIDHEDFPQISFSRPSQGFLQQWLRERHIHIEIELINDMDGHIYIATIKKHVGFGKIFDKSLKGYDIFEDIPIHIDMSSSYEEVLEKALYKSLQLIKTPKT
jgi:hypothetical protein